MRSSLRFHLIGLFFLCSSVLFAQNYTISGYIRDENSGEDLIYATIYAEEAEKGVASNVYGFYSLTLLRAAN